MTISQTRNFQNSQNCVLHSHKPKCKMKKHFITLETQQNSHMSVFNFLKIYVCVIQGVKVVEHSFGSL